MELALPHESFYLHQRNASYARKDRLSLFLILAPPPFDLLGVYETWDIFHRDTFRFYIGQPHRYRILAQKTTLSW